MIARVCALALITLCLLPFTQPFATDPPRAFGGESSGLKARTPHAGSTKSIELDSSIRSKNLLHAPKAVAVAPSGARDVTFSIEATPHHPDAAAAPHLDPPSHTPLRV